MGFFKAYDMRGTYGVDFDLETVYRVGCALPKVVGGTRWLVGRDGRTSSPAVHDALVKGLVAAGAEVSDLGICSTPMVYFFTAEDGFDGSVMITASHNPPSDNGLKVSKRGALPVGYVNGLNEVERLVKASTERFAADTPVPPVASVPEARDRYLMWQRARLPDLTGLRFAVDCSNGMASLFAAELFPTALRLNDTVDGSFPSHSPNPLNEAAREQIAACVRAEKLDCGVIFDGDADRCMFVDERGDFVQPDYLIPIVAKATIEFLTQRHRDTEAKKPELRDSVPLCLKIIHDVRTSRGAIEELRRMGCEPVMVPVGHAFAKPILREIGAVCGGELAGHYYFSEFHGCDSGVLAALRILGEIAKAKQGEKTFSEMMRPISGVYENSGEMNFKVEDKDAAIARVLSRAAESLPQPVSRSEIDGIRIEYAEGWINIRKSNTEPYLRLIIERKERVEEWTEILSKAIG